MSQNRTAPVSNWSRLKTYALKTLPWLFVVWVAVAALIANGTVCVGPLLSYFDNEVTVNITSGWPTVYGFKSLWIETLPTVPSPTYKPKPPPVMPWLVSPQLFSEISKTSLAINSATSLLAIFGTYFVARKILPRIKTRKLAIIDLAWLTLMAAITINLVRVSHIGPDLHKLNDYLNWRFYSDLSKQPHWVRLGLYIGLTCGILLCLKIIWLITLTCIAGIIKLRQRGARSPAGVDAI